MILRLILVLCERSIVLTFKDSARSLARSGIASCDVRKRDLCAWAERELAPVCEVRAFGCDENQGVLRVWVPLACTRATLIRLDRSDSRPRWLRIEVNPMLDT